MSEFLRLMTKFTEEGIQISGALLTLVLLAFVGYWFYNRRKYHKLAHQIPATVVKNYLDSIIQNSNALKSSLFRGGGLEMGEGVPAVKPVSDMGDGGISPSDYNAKLAMISSLEAQLAEKQRLISELEAKVSELQASGGGGEGGIAEEVHKKVVEENEQLKAKIAELEASGGGGGGGDSAAVAEVTKERDELKERLQEYEIIEDDLANLKRLQQENEQLKQSLAAGGGAAPAAAAPAAEPTAAPAPEPEPEPEPVAEAEPEEAEEAAPEPAPAPENPVAEGDAPEVEGEGKSAEDLLSEFEKMLG